MSDNRSATNEPSGLRAFVLNNAPTWVVDRIRASRLTARAQQLQAQAAPLSGIDEIVDAAFGYGYFYPNQIRSEIVNLLNVLAAKRPRRVMEIGSQGGGNLFLLSKTSAPDARMLSLDLNFSEPQLAAYPHLARPPQTLTCFKGDSHSSAMRDRVKQWLGGEQLDFLFIDGDHSYDGVKADYEMYAPFVAPDGLIGFHDIVPDYTTRYGKKTMAVSGEVPQYWNEIKTSYTEYREFIDNPDQDGAGIGLVVRSALRG